LTASGGTVGVHDDLSLTLNQAGFCTDSGVLTATQTAGTIVHVFCGLKRAGVWHCRYWWFTQAGSVQRQRVSFSVEGILVGPLLGKAIAIINNVPQAGECILGEIISYAVLLTCW
jgi:hypothetical protein